MMRSVSSRSFISYLTCLLWSIWFLQSTHAWMLSSSISRVSDVLATTTSSIHGNNGVVRHSIQTSSLHRKVQLTRIYSTSPSSKPSNRNDTFKHNWESGKVFTEGRRRSRERSLPWWMSDEERNHPRILPHYKPWWLEHNCEVNDSWKVADLRLEAERRGLSTSGLKKDLIERINISFQQYSISDENFTTPNIIPASADDYVYPCYPQAYEAELYKQNLSQHANQ